MSAETLNACVYLVDRQVEAGRGGHLAVTGPAGSLSYAELAARAAELAAGFTAHGVRPEERVLLVATDRPEAVVTFCALLRMGAIPVPVSTMCRAEELGELVRDSRARMVVATPGCAEVAAAAGQALDASALIAFCREGLASFKRPREVLALDALPKTATGKVRRGAVRDVVGQRLGQDGG